MLLLYTLIVLFTVTQSLSTKFYAKSSNNPYFYNAIKSFFALPLMLLLNGFNIQFDTITLILGITYGISLCLSMYSGYKALQTGPMSLTSLIVSFSIVIPILYGFIFCNESVTTYKIFGILFLMLAIILINTNSKKNPDTKINLKWCIFVLLTFLANGICSVIQKKHQILCPGKYAEEFMFFSMLLCAVIYILISLKKFPLKQLLKTKGKWLGVLSTIAGTMANYLTLILVGMENASVLFPIISSGTIFTTVLCGVIVFKENLKFNQIIAIICGIASIFFLKI